MMILSSDDYIGPYEQKYDPEHKHRPHGSGWRKIDTGWARGTSKKTLPMTAAPIPISRNAIEFLKTNSKNSEKYVSGNIAKMFSIADDAIKHEDNPREKYPEINDWIVGFADKKKPKIAHQLSAHIAYMRGHDLDFRNEGKPIVKHNEQIEKQLQEYIATEQEIIKASGLVDDDGYITLFRNTDENQFESHTVPSMGQKGEYAGNNVESWTTNPDLEWYGTKVTAKVPITSCLASCIGRRNNPFMKSNECEIMVCGKEIPKVMAIGYGGRITVKKLRQSYLNKVAEKLTKHIEKHATDNSSKERKSSLFQNPFIMNRLERIAKRIIMRIIG